MSAYLYDQAVVDRLRKITGDGRIHVIDPDQAVTFLAQFSKDKVKFPAIVLSRKSVSLLDYKNQVVALKGQTARVGEDNILVKAKLIPMRIEWNLDIYTVDRYSCDEIVRELIFYFTSSPRFEVEVPYQLDIKQNFDVFLSPEIADNTDLIEFPNRGEFFRETLSLWTENAHMFSSHRQYQTFTMPDVDANKNKSNLKGDE